MIDRIPFNVIDASIENNNLIEASAGTGKTWSLTGLYLRMVVENNLLPENILVVTYTKSATAELNGRIRERLQSALKWSDGEHTDNDKELFEALFLSWKSQGLDSEIRERLNKALSGFDKAAIYTIHSFCQRLLNDYAFEAGGRFNLTPVTDSSEQLETVVYDFWRQKMEQSSKDKAWVSWLVDNKQSPDSWLEAVSNYKSKPYQKIFETAEADIEIDIDDSEQEIVTACDEYEQSENKLTALQKKSQQLWDEKAQEIITCLKKAVEQGDLRASSYKLEMIDEYQQNLNNVLENIGILNRNLKANEAKFCQKNLNAATLKNHDTAEHDFFLLMDKLVQAYDENRIKRKAYNQLSKQIAEAKDAIYKVQLQKTLYELLIIIDKKFPELKLKQGIIDFDDMILNVYHALENDQKKDAFAQAVSQQFRAAMIDEFQDTDPLQLKIFKQLFVQTNTPLFYVGDPKQAIYSFRGADIHAYYQAAQEADSQLTLMKNYRSTPEMVDSVNALFSTRYKPFISDNIVFDWVESIDKAQFVVETDDDDADEDGHDDGNEEPNSALQFFVAQQEDNEPFSRKEANPLAVRHTVEKISQLLEKSRKGQAYFVDEKGKKRSLIAGDIAILVPRHIDGAEIFSALSLRGIASVRQGQDKVMESQSASTVLRLVHAVADPGNESFILQLLGDPLVGYSAAEIFELKENSIAWEAIIDKFWELRNSWLESGFSVMFRHWLSWKGTQELCLSERLMAYMEGERFLTDLMHLAEIMQQQSRYSGGIQALINWLQHAMEGHNIDDEYQLRLESDSKRVKIVTLHACKGLEYNLVFCPFLWAGQIPRKDSIISAHKNDEALLDFGSQYFDEHAALANEESLMEQLRLLYVALTRAVHRCYIFWAHVQYGQYTYTANSALAWLLYGDASMQAEGADNVFEQLRSKVSAMSFDAIVKGVDDLCLSAQQRQPGNVNNNAASIAYEIITDFETGGFINFNETDVNKLSIAIVSQRTYSPAWLQTSFSALVKAQHVSFQYEALSEHVDDLALQSDIKAETAAIDIFSFPRGAGPGECIHSIFENWDFGSTDKDQLSHLVAKEMDRYSVAKAEQRTQWIEPVCRMVLDTLHRPLGGGDFCLAQLPAAQRQAEMEFLISARGSIKRLQTVLTRHEKNLPVDFTEAVKQIDSRLINGFLTGFIDLIFIDEQGKYCVLDWKSNHLGMSSADYGQKQMERAMASHHYYLQALVYQVALHRYLTQNLADYNIQQHLGGAWYLFLRGIEINAEGSNNEKNGIYHFQPAAQLIIDLNEALLPVEK